MKRLPKHQNNVLGSLSTLGNNLLWTGIIFALGFESWKATFGTLVLHDNTNRVTARLRQKKKMRSSARIEVAEENRKKWENAQPCQISVSNSEKTRCKNAKAKGDGFRQNQLVEQLQVGLRMCRMSYLFTSASMALSLHPIRIYHDLLVLLHKLSLGRKEVQCKTKVLIGYYVTVRCT